MRDHDGMVEGGISRGKDIIHDHNMLLVATLIATRAARPQAAVCSDANITPSFLSLPHQEDL